MPQLSKLKLKLLPILLLGLGALLLIPNTLLAQDLTSPLIKSGLILKFAQHVEWKQEENIDTFRIGVYGEEPELMANLLLLESVNIKDKPLIIRQFRQLDDIYGVHLLYFTRDKNSEIQRITNHISGTQTLMVSDRARNQKLIMINFLPLVDGKVDFELNKTNITNARLTVTPALLLLGGTDVDVAGLYKQSQRALKRFKTQIDELSESYNNKSKQIESLNEEINTRNEEISTRNEEIEKQSKEIEIQKKLNDEQMRKFILQQEQMDARAEELAIVLEEVEIKQQTLDSKIELIRNQEQEINSQRTEIENRNSILKEQEDEIQIQEKKIEEQVSQLSKFANRVARQRIFLYIVIAVCFLIGGLVFFIYRSYKVKRDANHEIQMANEVVVATNEALEDQKKELLYTLENLKLTQSQLIQAEKMASVGVLTAGIAHELNNPINFVSGNVKPLQRDLEDVFSIIKKYEDIIETKKLDKEFRDVSALMDQLDYSFLIQEIDKLLEGIKEGAKRSSQIVKGLRSFSRLDEEQFQIYDIHEGIESSLILLHNKTKNRITIHRDYADFKSLECYPSKINQVLMNVLTNSIQAIEGKGDIYIHTLSTEIGFKIVIKDNGTGMTPEVKEHIFEPFYTTKEVGKGTGLGLSISFGIIEQHNGQIDIISEPNKGTEFIITLPKTQSE